MINLKDYLEKTLYIVSKYQSQETAIILPEDRKKIDDRWYTTPAISTNYFKNLASIDSWSSGELNPWLDDKYDDDHDNDMSDDDTIRYGKYAGCGEYDYFYLSQFNLERFLNSGPSLESGDEYYFDIAEANARLEEIKKVFKRMNEEAREEAIRKYHEVK